MEPRKHKQDSEPNQDLLFINNNIIEPDFYKVLKEFFPNQKIFKEFNPITEEFVDKTYCFSCYAGNEFPTMYFNNKAYGCYVCGHRGNTIQFLHEIIQLKDNNIAEYLIAKKHIKINKKQRETILEDISDKICEDVHETFEREEFCPGTACIELGHLESEKLLTDYIRIRKTIWKEDLPYERQKLEEIRSAQQQKTDINTEGDLPF